jgi:glycosyltransferase involved in cell wall biosynthesis
MRKDKLSIGFIGTRGIPNEYGGYEAAVQELAPRLAAKGHDVTVYCSNSQKSRFKEWNGVRLIYSYDPEKYIGSAGQFVYDLISNIKSRKQNHDVIFHMGYTSDSALHRFWSKNAFHITNMDGLEWKRTKYSNRARKFLAYAEKLAAFKSDLLIADNKGVEGYLVEKYPANVFQIAYGVEIPTSFDKNHLVEYNVSPGSFDLVIARIVPENNIEYIIKAKLSSNDEQPLLIIGNHTTHRDELMNKYSKSKKVIFNDGNFNREVLDSLRHYSRYYIHGHSVGGTNPSLLEAMAAKSRIIAHENQFNRNVLLDGGLYFENDEQLMEYFNRPSVLVTDEDIQHNIENVKSSYNWGLITYKYEEAAYQHKL